MIICCFIVKLESRMNPKFLTLFENAVPTVTDDDKQSEGRESVEKTVTIQTFIYSFLTQSLSHQQKLVG